jgi:hypothetical protein
MIHVSVIERLGTPIPGRFRTRQYEPRNFVNMLDAVKSTYAMPEQSTKDEIALQIVGWDGKPLDPKVENDRLLAAQVVKPQPNVSHKTACMEGN